MFFCLCLLLQTKAQIYLKAYSGYVFSAAPYHETTSSTINGVENIYDYKYKMGKGVNIGTGVGYSFNKNFSVELTANTQIFTGAKIFVPPPVIEDSANFSISGQFGHLRYHSLLIQFAPQLKYSVECAKKIGLFVKAGPDFMYVATYYNSNSPTMWLDSTGWSMRNINETFANKGKLGLGIQASAGVDYKLSANVRIFAEFLSVICNYNFYSYKITGFYINGVNHTADLNPASFKIEGGDKVNFSQYGINIGVIYSLLK